MNNQKVLRDVLKRGANNFDILRLIAALAVIVGHSYAIAPQPPYQDGVLSILHFDYSGSLAVKFFFFLSGLLVTNSIVTKPDAFRFLGKRAFRIFPGLIVCLLISVFIVGPLFTKLSLGAYFSDSETWHYLFNNTVLINMRWRLPEVFAESKFGLNGSLWTLPYEVLCYIYLAVFYGLGLLKNKIVANVVFISVIVISLFAPSHLPSYFSQNPDAYLLPACFALGALFANNKEYIKINLSHVILLWLLVWAFKDSIGFQFLFYIALFYSTVYISSTDFVVKHLKLPFDASYGVYVYGFMIQQCLHAIFPGMGVHGNQLLAGVIAVAMGILSWYVIEKRFIMLGNQLFTAGTSNHKLFSMSSLVSQFKTGFQSEKYPIVPRALHFSLLVVVAFAIYALVLIFIFPGYFSPLSPHHSDFYIPAAFANAPGSYYSFASFLTWPRPVFMFFYKLSGYFGNHGSMIWVIVLVFVNCALTAWFAKRVFKLSFGWPLLLAFTAYCYLLFSQPYFYIFYAQDIGSQMCYFFLLLGAFSYYLNYESRVLMANVLLFVCCLLAFLSKETYGLVAVFLAGVWFIYYRKTSFWKAGVPVLITGISLAIAFAVNILAKSVFVNPEATTGSDYHIVLHPVSVFGEWFRYAREAVNITNILLLLLVGYLCWTYKNHHKKEFIYLIIGCTVAATLSWLPNALLPNHHYLGYSFNGLYLFYLPLFFLPVLWKQRHIPRLLVAAALLCFVSPIFNISKYNDDKVKWVLIQEDIQRNFLEAFEQSTGKIMPSKDKQRILIDGITFPFHPFSWPESVRAFPNAAYAYFDVVNYNPGLPNGERRDLVKLIDPTAINLADYDQKWVFDGEGRLVKTENLLAERVMGKIVDTVSTVNIDLNGLSKLTTTGFYEPEGGIRWTNGSASIDLASVIKNKDSLVVQLNTYMPPICKEVNPELSLLTKDNKMYKSVLTTRNENTFYYVFVPGKGAHIQKVNILSQKVDASPDKRTLSFPFVSLVIK